MKIQQYPTGDLSIWRIIQEHHVPEFPQLAGVSRDLSAVATSNSRCGTWFQRPEFNKNGPKEQVRGVDPWTT